LEKIDIRGTENVAGQIPAGEFPEVADQMRLVEVSAYGRMAWDRMWRRSKIAARHGTG
jgi:hypothetical protein